MLFTTTLLIVRNQRILTAWNTRQEEDQRRAAKPCHDPGTGRMVDGRRILERYGQPGAFFWSHLELTRPIELRRRVHAQRMRPRANIREHGRAEARGLAIQLDQGSRDVRGHGDVTGQRRNGLQRGCDLFIELGPGGVLAGLLQRTRKGTEVLSVSDPASVKAFAEKLRESA